MSMNWFWNALPQTNHHSKLKNIQWGFLNGVLFLAEKKVILQFLEENTEECLESISDSSHTWVKQKHRLESWRWRNNVWWSLIDFDEEEQVSRMKGGNSWEGGGKVSLRGGRGGCQQALEGWVGWGVGGCQPCAPVVFQHASPIGNPSYLWPWVTTSWILESLGSLIKECCFIPYIFVDDHFPYVHIDPYLLQWAKKRKIIPSFGFWVIWLLSARVPI